MSDAFGRALICFTGDYDDDYTFKLYYVALYIIRGCKNSGYGLVNGNTSCGFDSTSRNVPVYPFIRVAN